MSFRDDKFLWKDASRRILNLQHSSSAGTLSTNLNVILDELNSLDYATSVVENEEDALRMLSKCCTLLYSSGNDEFLVTKFCQLIVNLFAKQKVTVNQETLNGLLSFLIDCIKTCKKWTLLNILRALGSTLYENGSLCAQFGDSLLARDGVLVRLCRDESQDSDVLCSAVQCVANVCMRSSNGLCLEDKFITPSFNLLLDLLQTSSPKLCGTDIEHFTLVNTVLRALQHVLVLSCLGQNQNLGPLLASLKNYMFCGMPGYKPVYTEKNCKQSEDQSGIEPDDLSSVHLNTIPQRDRTYSILSKKKKRRSNNKKSKPMASPSTPKQITVGSSSMDALTPTFAKCNLNYTAPKDPASVENHSISPRLRNPPRHAAHFTGNNVNQYRDSAATYANAFEGSGAESSGYHSASSLSTASSDSEYSDSEAGQTARLRSITSKIRLNVLLCLQAVIKSTDKKVLFGYWSSFVPDNTVSSSWSLFTTILKDPTPKGRAGGVAVLMDLLDGSRQFLVAAEDREQHSSSASSRPYTSFSVKLSGIVHELHRCLLQALIAETSGTTKAQILKCLSLLVLNSPYNRLKQGLLTKVARQLRPLLALKDPNVQTAVLSCLRMVVCVHTPLQEVAEIMRPTSAEVNNTGNRSMPQTNSSVPECGSSSAVMSPELEVPSESPWLIQWCIDAINRRENSLVVRLEALQVLGSFVKSYVFLLSSSVVECLRNLACSCLKDVDISFTLSAMKLLEELARAMYAEFSNTHTGRNAVSKEQILQFWLKLLDGPLISMIQEGSSVSAPSCSAAVDCMSNIGAVIFNELPVHKRILCITLLLGLSNDEDKNVKASSIRALGVFVLYPCLRDDVLFVADTANAVLTAMTDAKIMVRMKAAWALANLSDSLVTNMSCGDRLDFLEDFSDMLLLKLLNTSITAADENEKVKSNAVRALGNFLRYTRTSSLDKPGFMEAVEKAVQALVRNVGSGLMKVRWNACYAIGNVFRNPFLPTGTAPWTTEIYSGLENVIRDCKNFKVRINAVIPLSLPPERRYYGDVTLYSHVYATLIDALKGTENVTEFCEFKYRDTLRQQLCNSLCHMTRLMTAEDAASLGTVLEEIHDTYKQYITYYIRQLSTQESPVEDQTDEKTAAEKLSAVHGAHRRVHEELEQCSTAVKILQDVFGELPKNTETKDDTYNTEIKQSDMTHSTLPD